MTSRRTIPARPLLALLIVAAVVAAWPIWTEIARIAYRDTENSHILLALPVAAFLLYLRRGRLRRIEASPSILGLGVLIAAAAGMEIGRVFAIDLARHLGALLLVLGVTITVIGWRPLLRFKAPLLALAFLLPVPGMLRQRIAIPLQEASASVVTFALDLFAVPVEQSGNALTINGVDVAVAEACNGMRMVSALALVTVLFVFSVPMRNSIRVLFLALSPLVALIVNVIRLVPTTLLYGYASEGFADVFHDISGWAALVVALALLAGVSGLLRWLEFPIEPYPVRVS